ncbi:uncharacterized protein LOC131671829 [Phymastichus coffea]|uniref:uncharacterized protein LOC131671829 n=1 Tax=Phymastichus coffea TaxID=108790 RepID=UPI00273CEE46|nr:uncharacterized protein LOC131671829 [Phymastichus coffea]
MVETTPSSSGYQFNGLRDHFPINTMRDFKKNEDLLGQNETYRCAVKDFFYDQGESTGHKFCVRMLEQAVTDKIASNFCFVGNSVKKAAFSKTDIWTIIKDNAVQRFKDHPEQKFTFAMAENSCGTWLRQAPFRMNRKKKKSERKKKKTIEDFIDNDEDLEK